jgi:hypothetical protein
MRKGPAIVNMMAGFVGLYVCTTVNASSDHSSRISSRKLQKNQNKKIRIKYLRPVKGCRSAEWCGRAAAGGDANLGLLTFVLVFANSNRIVCGRLGSKRTPCGKGQFDRGKKRAKEKEKQKIKNSFFFCSLQSISGGFVNKTKELRSFFAR